MDSVGDRTFVSTLRLGRSPRLVTVDRVRQFMADYAAPFIEEKKRRRRAETRKAYRERQRNCVPGGMWSQEPVSADCP
jgi:hypothetical protein